MRALCVATEGKGIAGFFRRGVSILRCYGLVPGRMERTLAHFAAVVRQFGCGATLPITGVTLERYPATIWQYTGQGIELAIHGYRHVDHSSLLQEEQEAELRLAKRIFADAGIEPLGFRGPYLRYNEGTLAVLRRLGLTYDASTAIAWDVLEGRETPAYQRALRFYGALSADAYPSLPSLEGGLVRIPYSLPDDEALVERLGFGPMGNEKTPWQAILSRTYELGELFVLGLHPERTLACLEPLRAVLEQARSCTPPIWVATLGQIAEWWLARARATVQVTHSPQGSAHCVVDGPPGTTVLARAVQVQAPTQAWDGSYERVLATAFAVQAPVRPWVGLCPSSAPQLADFLRQQGYIVETTSAPEDFAYSFDRPAFRAEDQRALLAELQRTERPLIRLGRWPDSARSALSITGDIDALTLWDYGLRLLGR